MKYLKKFTVKEWGKFDYMTGDIINGEELTGQEILLDKYKIILTDHRTRKEKFNDMFDRIFKADIDKALNKVTKGIDDFSKVMDSTKGIGGKPKDLSGLLYTRKSAKKTSKRKRKVREDPERLWNSKGMSLTGKSFGLSGTRKGLKLR